MGGADIGIQYFLANNAADRWPLGDGQTANVTTEGASQAQSNTLIRLYSITRLTAGGNLTVQHGDGATAYFVVSNADYLAPMEFPGIELADGLSATAASSSVWLIGYKAVRTQTPATPIPEPN